ncbi:hypothetical protein [Streptomyces sp. NPDC088766]|uniref:hypothetical protein n=1 Tax=Streptomyces sp. NPDC088766 TaxID=3365893 RepID=UPI003800396E
MSRSQRFRTPAALGAATFTAAALPLFGATAANATDNGCQSATVQYRVVDGGGRPVEADWTSQGGFRVWDTPPGAVEVRLAPGQKIGDGCRYPVSLAEYTTEGPKWETSGRQTYVDKATVYLTAADVADDDDAERTYQKLTVETPDCYGQIDLYGDDVVYDGKPGDGHGPLPYQPDGVITPYHLIAAWNGGDKECAPAEPDTPSPTPSESAPDEPGTPTSPADSTPPAQDTAPPTTPEPATSTPSTTSDVPPLESTPPAAPEPSPQGSTQPLAETGSSAPVGLIAGGAALAVAIGAGTIYATTRTRRS